MCGHNVSKDHNAKNALFVKVQSAKALQQPINLQNGQGPIFVHVAQPPGLRKRQSPINIITSNTLHDKSLAGGGFKINYVPDDFVELQNTGSSWQINLKDDSSSSLQANHLNGTYKLKQIHCHWGDKCINGSEHTVDGAHYAAEIHLVHYKVEYGDFVAALEKPDGLAVIGIFLQESSHDNPALNAIVGLMEKTKYKGETVPLVGCNPRDLIPANPEFWTYEGSLTTPTYKECVIWIIFRSSIPISRKQLDVFRSLYVETSDNAKENPAHLQNNIRAIQSLNGRQIRASF